MSEPILVIDDLVVEFHGRKKGESIRAVDGIDLTVSPGEVVALVGESGCGKTTTANAVLGLVSPSSGHVTVGGVDVARADRKDLKSTRATMQMIAQDPYESLNPRMTIGEIVVEPLVIHDLAEGDMRARAAQALGHAGLSPPTEFMSRRPHELSGGQRQRVVIAAALSIEPRLIVADEPVSMLDVSIRAGILNLLQNLAREDGIGILMITHDLSTVAAYCDRIAVMYLGKIVEIGDTEDILGNPQHPYTRALLSAVPVPDPSYARVEPDIKGGISKSINPPPQCRFIERCPWANETCESEDHPPLEDKGEGHYVACHLVEKSAAVV